MAHLERHYIGLETLAKRSGVTPERVLDLIHGQCEKCALGSPPSRGPARRP